MVLRQHCTIAPASLSRLFAPLPQFRKREIHTVFLHFRNFELEQKSLPRLLAELCGAALTILSYFLFAKKRVLLYCFALLRWSCCYTTSQAIDIQIAVFTCSAGSISYRASSSFDRCFTENLLVLISNAILPKATQWICNQILFCLLNPAHKRCPLFGYFVPFVCKVFFVHNRIFNPVFSSSYFDKLQHLVDNIAQRFIGCEI